MDRGVFGEEKIRTVQRQVAVNFISGYLMVTDIAESPAGIHHGGSSDDVRFQEDSRIFDGAVYVAFSSEIDHGIRFFLFKKLEHAIPVADIKPDETEIRIIHDRCQRGQVPRISQLIDADDPVFRMGFEMIVNEISANESGTAGNNDRGHN